MFASQGGCVPPNGGLPLKGAASEGGEGFASGGSAQSPPCTDI